MGSVSPFDSGALQGLTEMDPFQNQNALTRSSQVINLVLFIIGCVAVAGHMNGVVAGGCVVGFSVPLILTAIGSIISAKHPLLRSAAVYQLIQAVALTIIGSLAIAGIVTPITAGWCVIAPTIIGLSLACCCVCCGGCAYGVLTLAQRQ